VTLARVPILSPNYSARGSGVRLVVLHTAEGARTYQSLGNYFANPASGVSSQVGIDDTPGTVGEYVRREHKAWTQGEANPYSVSAELCAFAAWTYAEWQLHPNMLANTAAWVAEECAAFGIPLRALSASEAQGGAAGVCQHNDLGAMGGGHWDCGSGFPLDDVLEMAAGGRPNAAPSEGDENMVLLDERSGGYWVAFRDGAVHAYKGAPVLGAINTEPDDPGDFPCIGIAARLGGDGYTLALDLGNRDVRFYEYPYDGSAARV
jgi:hypothetical protein